MAIKSLARALRVLRCFDTQRPEWGITELGRSTGLDKSHVAKIVHEFVAERYLVRDNTSRRYRVGPRALGFGAAYIAGSNFAGCGEKIARRLVEQTGFTVTLNVMDGVSVALAACVSGNAGAHPSYRVGSYLPSHATAAGKVSAAFLADVDLSRLLDRESFPAVTCGTIRDPGILKREIAEARREGFAKTCGESTPGVAAVAVPVLGEETQYFGAISLLVPIETLRRSNQRILVAQLRAAAAKLSYQLGARSYPYPVCQ